MKRLLILLIIASSCYAQNVRRDDLALVLITQNTSFGTLSYLKPAPGAIVTIGIGASSCSVTNTPSGSVGSCSPLASLCSSISDITCNQPNPTNADNLGNYGFWLIPGTYQVAVSGLGVNGKLITYSMAPVGGSFTASSVTVTGLTQGNCVQTGLGGLLTGVTGPCAPFLSFGSNPTDSTLFNTLTSLVSDPFSTPGPLSTNWKQLGGVNNFTIGASGVYVDIPNGQSTGGQAGAIYTPGGLGTDQYSEITVGAMSGIAGNEIGAAVRMTIAGNLLSCYSLEARNDNAMELVLVQNGILGTNITQNIPSTGFGRASIIPLNNFTGFGTIVPGDVLRLEAVGSTLTAKKNGSVVGTATDTTLASGGIGLEGFQGASLVPSTALKVTGWRGVILNVGEVFSGVSLTSAPNNVTLLNAQANAAAIVGTSSPVSLYTYTLPANTVASLKGIRVSINVNHSTGSASVAYILTLNGQTVYSNSNAGTGFGSASFTILNTGSTTGTIGAQGHLFGTGGDAFGGAIGGLAWGLNQVLTITFNVAATDQVTPIQWIVELIQ